MFVYFYSENMAQTKLNQESYCFFYFNSMIIFFVGIFQVCFCHFSAFAIA